MFSFILPAALAAIPSIYAVSCPILFDGRIPGDFALTDFDSAATSSFDPANVLGSTLQWSEIIQFPNVSTSLFDVENGTKAFEVTLSDQSIFVPGGQQPQNGFRRAELLPKTDPSTGVTTIHWSMQIDSSRALNYSHEYHPIFHETSDFSTNQFVLFTGTPFGSTGGVDPMTLRLQGRQSASPVTTYFETAFTADTWHNFAITVGWSTNQFTVYYSTDSSPLAKVADSTNDNSGGGQFHVGLLKLPTGPNGIDVVHQGDQESGINEGLIYGSVFVENSSDGCVSLAPSDGAQTQRR